MENIILEQQKVLEKMVAKEFPSQEQLNSWYKHKSNKEKWCEAQESEEAEIDEGGEEITKEDEEKINDAIDTEDLGAKADMEWSKEKDEKAINN